MFGLWIIQKKWDFLFVKRLNREEEDSILDEHRNKKEKGKLGIYLSYGISFGILFGATLIEFFGFISVGVGIILGMLFGSLFYIIKKGD